ncbi:hypothetical protein [Streptomyces sp. NPDC002156]
MSSSTAVILLACALAIVLAILVAATAGYLARRHGHATYPESLAWAACAFTTSLTVASSVASTLATLIG